MALRGKDNVVYNIYQDNNNSQERSRCHGSPVLRRSDATKVTGSSFNEIPHYCDNDQRNGARQRLGDYDRARNQRETRTHWVIVGEQMAERSPSLACDTPAVQSAKLMSRETERPNDKSPGIRSNSSQIYSVGCTDSQPSAVEQNHVFSMQGEWKFGRQHGHEDCCYCSTLACSCEPQGNVLYYESTPGEKISSGVVEKQRNCKSDSGNSYNSLNSSPGFQEGVKSMLYWHIIGSYQNLNQLSDRDCGELLIGLRDQGSYTCLNSEEGGSKPSSDKCQSSSHLSEEYPIKSGVQQPGIGYQTFCTCWINNTEGSPQVSPPVQQSSSFLQTDHKVCSLCGKYLENRYLTSSSRTDLNLVKEDNPVRFPSERDDDLFPSDSLPQKLLQVKPAILAHPKLQDLNETLTYLTQEHEDGEEKQCKLAELDNALDYLTDMVTESSPEETYAEVIMEGTVSDGEVLRVHNNSKLGLYFADIFLFYS